MKRDEALSLMKKSQLCIGLDLRVSNEDKLNKALEIIDLTHDLTSSFKPNRQYWLGSSTEDMIKITSRIKKYNCFSIMDHKLSDIGSSNEMALKHTKKEGFDFITVSPFPGNMRENNLIAGKIDLGLISLTMMSNPAAVWMRDTDIYLDYARDAERYSEGIVVGTTNHVTINVMREIKKLTPSTFVLAPGIGRQGGNINDVLSVFESHALFNVSRGITLSKDIRGSAEDYHSIIYKNKNN